MMHGSLVIRTIGRIIESLEDLEAVMPTLERLGRSHAAMGVAPESLAALRECLMEALAESLGPANWSPEVEAAWRAAYDVISAAMSVAPGGVGLPGPAFDSEIMY